MLCRSPQPCARPALPPAQAPACPGAPFRLSVCSGSTSLLEAAGCFAWAPGPLLSDLNTGGVTQPGCWQRAAGTCSWGTMAGWGLPWPQGQVPGEPPPLPILPTGPERPERRRLGPGPPHSLRRGQRLGARSQGRAQDEQRPGFVEAPSPTCQLASPGHLRNRKSLGSGRVCPWGSGGLTEGCPLHGHRPPHPHPTGSQVGGASEELSLPTRWTAAPQAARGQHGVCGAGGRGLGQPSACAEPRALAPRLPQGPLRPLICLGSGGGWAAARRRVLASGPHRAHSPRCPGPGDGTPAPGSALSTPGTSGRSSSPGSCLGWGWGQRENWGRRPFPARGRA